MERRKANQVKVFDPHIKRDIVENQYHDFDEFLNNIEILLIMNAHTHLKENVDKVKNKIIFDTKNVMNFKNVYKL